MYMNAVCLACLLLQSPIEVPFRVGDEAIIVQASVNGRSVSLMLDTGFSGSVVISDQINIGKSTGKADMRDFIGTFQASTVPIESFNLGSISVTGKSMMAVQQPVQHLTQAYNAHTDGILGMQVFSDRVFEINFEKQRLIFHPDTTDLNLRQADNKRTFLQRMLPIGQNSIHLTAATKDGKKMTLGLDTGNAYFLVTHEEVLERVGLWPVSRQPRYIWSSIVASGLVDSFLFHAPPLEVFGVPVERSLWTVIRRPSSTAEFDGTVGYGFLKHFNVTIDMKHRRVWLEKIKEFEGESRSDAGITAGYMEREGRVMILQVTPGGPADQAGIQAGDALLAVDERDLSRETFRDISRLLEGKDGTVVNVVTSRQGVLKRSKLTRKPLVNDYKQTD